MSEKFFPPRMDGKVFGAEMTAREVLEEVYGGGSVVVVGHGYREAGEVARKLYDLAYSLGNEPLLKRRDLTLRFPRTVGAVRLIDILSDPDRLKGLCARVVFAPDVRIWLVPAELMSVAAERTSYYLRGQ